MQHRHEQITQRSTFCLRDITAVFEAFARQKNCQITCMMGVGVFEVAAEQNCAAAHEKRTGADLVLDGSHGCAGFCRFRCCCHAVVEIGVELTG